MHRIGPHELSATLAEMGGGPAFHCPPTAETEEIHLAVRRIKVGGGGEPAAAPRDVLINLSLTDEMQPFARIMSPNARA
jgi:hypothetical protein